MTMLQETPVKPRHAKPRKIDLIDLWNAFCLIGGLAFVTWMIVDTAGQADPPGGWDVVTIASLVLIDLALVTLIAGYATYLVIRFRRRGRQ
jgi:hypothetical protein